MKYNIALLKGDGIGPEIVDSAVRVLSAVGEKYGYPTIYLGDLGEDDAMMAKELYEHKGVGMHPGDKGMENIALRIWKELEKEF